MNVDAVICHRAGDPTRDRNLAYVIDWYAASIVLVSDSPGRRFSRAAAFNRGVEQASSNVVVLTNSDVIVDHNTLDKAIALARKTGVTVYPFTRYAELTEECSREWLERGDEPCYDVAYEMGDESVGPILCIRRDAYQEAGGMDERFTGWGFEDVAWEITSRTLLGPSRRVEGTAWHLWHPFHPDSRRGGGEDGTRFQRNQRLCNRYRRAEGNPDKLERVRQGKR
jgi:hypothetical protein